MFRNQRGTLEPTETADAPRSDDSVRLSTIHHETLISRLSIRKKLIAKWALGYRSKMNTGLDGYHNSVDIGQSPGRHDNLARRSLNRVLCVSHTCQQLQRVVTSSRLKSLLLR